MSSKRFEGTQSNLNKENVIFRMEEDKWKLCGDVFTCLNFAFVETECKAFTNICAFKYDSTGYLFIACVCGT